LKISAELYHKPVLWNSQRRSWEFHSTLILYVAVSLGNISRQILENSAFSSSRFDLWIRYKYSVWKGRKSIKQWRIISKGDEIKSYFNRKGLWET